MDPIDTRHVAKGFFNATSILKQLFVHYSELFQPDAVKAFQGLWQCFPPLVLPSNLNLKPFSLNRCTNRTGYLDFVAVFYPHVWQKMGRLSGPRRKKCRRFGIHLSALNCLGHDLEILLNFARDGKYEGTWNSIVASLGGPVRSWVSAWPNETLVVISSGQGRQLHPGLMSRRAENAILVTYAGATDWLEKHNAYAFTDRLAPSRPRAHATWQSSCSSSRSSQASGFANYHYPNAWPHDVTMQYPSPFDTKKYWRGPAERHILASFIGTPTHCSRQDLLQLWRGRNRTGLKVMETVQEKGLYSSILQQSRFCLVLDGHYPWTIRYLDVLQHGCVPAVVSESWHPPLHRLLAWENTGSFPTLLIHPRSMPVLDQLLARIPYTTWVKMQRLTIQLARIFDPRYSFCPASVLAEVFLSTLERHPELKSSR